MHCGMFTVYLGFVLNMVIVSVAVLDLDGVSVLFDWVDVFPIKNGDVIPASYVSWNPEGTSQVSC